MTWWRGSRTRTFRTSEADLSFLQPADDPNLLGLLGSYQVREVIGRGGMGVVLQAFDPELHRLVAIKVLDPALAGSATARRRFTRETQAAAAVCHDHVVAVHGVSEAGGLPYLVMQYVAGESLQARLDREGPLEAAEVVRIGMQTASGLAAAHAQGLIHRDIKPANLLLENGLIRVKITDFGLARMSDDVGLTQNGVVAGTPEYMAPEQARGEVVDHRADLFSLGSVLYACCTGRPPFRGSTALAVLARVSTEEPTPLRSLNPDVPAWLEAFIARLMTKDPAQRFPNAAEAAALLEGYLAHLRQPTTVSVPKLSPPLANAGSRSLPHGVVEYFRQHRWLTGLVLFILLGLGMALWFTAGRGAADPNAGNARVDAAAPKLRVRFHQDLRSADLNNSILRSMGEGIRFEAAGTRITLPAGVVGTPPAGLVTNAKVHGDFEITVSFEILKADRPPTGFGVGVSLYAAINPDANNAVSLAHRLMPDGKTVFISNRMTPAKDGLKHHVQTLPSTEAIGKLRLQRVGSRLRFLVADGNHSDFVQVDEVEFSPEDVRYVQFGGNTGGSASGLDLRLLDFTLRAEKLADTGDFSPDMAAAVSPMARSKKWLIALALCIGIFLSSGALGWWLMVRRRRVAEERISAAVADQQEATSAAAPPLSFPCSACGKRLKVKAELSGKKVKCPQCGKVGAVPAADTYRAEKPEPQP